MPFDRYNFYSRSKLNRGLPKPWFTDGVKPEDLSPHAVANDKWDREDLAAMKSEVAEFAAARDRLGRFAQTGDDAMEDMFFTLLKADPQLVDPSEIRPSNLVNRRIMEQAQELDECHRLRGYSVNDDVQAAMACTEMEPDLETLFDLTEQQRKEAQELQRKLAALAQVTQDKHDLDDVVRRWTQDQENMDGQCPTCEGTGQVPGHSDHQDHQDGQGQEQGEGAQGGEGDQGDQGDQGQPGEGEGEGEGQGEGQGGEGQPGEGTVPCPTCAGTGAGPGQPGQPGEGQPGEGQGEGQPGGGRPDELTEEQRKQLDDYARQQRELAEKIEQARKEAEAANEQFEDSMDRVRATVRTSLADAFERASEQAQTVSDTTLAWGLAPGTLTKMDAKERMELARKLNSDRFKRIADLFGPMRNMMLSEQKRRTVHTTEEIYDVEMGKDLGRLVPSELLALDDELTELDFLRRYQENALLQYAMQGEDKLARGGIIMAEDGSGSMRGERELWAKAVMLCLLHLCRQQKRSFRLIHFGSTNQIKVIEFTEPSHFSLDRIMEAAEVFWGGGTEFSGPMKQALSFLQHDHATKGETRADVVFVTDDECYVDKEFMTEYLDEMHRMDATTWGISVAGGMNRREGALDSMTEGKVATVKDLASGEDVRRIFRGV